MLLRKELIMVEDSPRITMLMKCYFTSTEIVGLLGTGAQDGHLDFHTAPELCASRKSKEQVTANIHTRHSRLEPSVITEFSAQTSWQLTVTR